jgi:hypothetical protein
VADVWFDPVFQDGDLEIIQNLIDNFLDNYWLSVIVIVNIINF